MRILYCVLTIVILSGCASEPPKPSAVELRRQAILACVKDMKQNESTTMESFEICRQVYQLHLVDDGKPKAGNQ